jgi:hypothetical protein
MTTLLREGGQRVDTVELLVVDLPAGETRSLRSRLATPVLAGEQPAGEGEIRDVGDAELPAEREDVLVVIAPEKVVVILKDREPCRSLVARHTVCLG